MEEKIKEAIKTTLVITNKQSIDLCVSKVMLIIDNQGWQTCPKCGGDGNLMRYNSPPLMGNACPVCDVCNGAKIISINTGYPPLTSNQ